MHRFSLKQKLAILAVAIVAAVLYCSWPLEYIVNPTVAAHGGLASELGAIGQPYWWVFNSSDIVASLLILVVAVLLWRTYTLHSRWLKVGLIMYAVFGVLTIVDAGMPLDCLPSAGQCGSIWHDPLIIAHGIASIGASMALFGSAVAMWRVSRQSKIKQLDTLMAVILAGWALFGIFSLIFFFYTGPGYLAQHYFITLCSVWVALLPFVVFRASKAAAVAPYKLKTS